MTGDPADIGHASEAIIWMDVEDVLDGESGAQQVSTSSVDNTLGLASRSRSLAHREVSRNEQFYQTEYSRKE